jgi:hypothetical protein
MTWLAWLKQLILGVSGWKTMVVLFDGQPDFLASRMKRDRPGFPLVLLSNNEFDDHVVFGESNSYVIGA